MDLGELQAALLTHAERQTKALESIKTAVWIMAGFFIAGLAIVLLNYLSVVLD
jgi:hypothetical protein